MRECSMRPGSALRSGDVCVCMCCVYTTLYTVLPLLACPHFVTSLPPALSPSPSPSLSLSPFSLSPLLFPSPSPFSPPSPQVLSSKRYDLEGFAEYARQLRECQAFQEREGASIGYVLRVHSALGKHGVEVPAQDKVHRLYGSPLSLFCLPPFPPLSPFLPPSTPSLLQSITC